MRARAARILLLAAAALLAGACSLSRVAYVNATPILAWYLDDYVDLTPVQKEWTHGRLARAMAWHRAAELPEYQRFLQSAIRSAGEGLTEAELRRIHAGLQGYYERAVAHLLPDMAEFVSQLDPGQAERLEAKFAEQNEKIVKDSLKGTPAERRERRAKRFLEFIGDWTGRLTPAQRALVAEGLAGLPDLTEERLGDRRYRQTEFVALVRARPTPPQAEAALRRLLLERDRWRRPDYAAKLRERDTAVIAMLARLDATLTPEQRRSVQEKLGDYLSDVSYLMAGT